MSKINSFIDKIFAILKEKKPVDKIVIDPGEREEDIGIQKSFVTQFAENQNHHQRLFIQFLSSVLVVIIAYAYVYSNTASNEGINVYKAIEKNKVTYPDSSVAKDSTFKKTNVADTVLMQVPVLKVKPDKFNSAKHENGSIISYSQFSLLSIYVFAQIVLLVLSIMILHMGYSYRRDQCVVSRIRKINLGIATYEKIYGTRNYGGTGKGFLEYLPNFNSILFFSICVIQTGLFISIFLYLDKFGHEVFLNLGKTYVTPPYEIDYRELSTSLFFPLLINFFIYTYYYNKYEFTVNQKDTYVPYTIRILNSMKIFLLYKIIILACASMLLYSFLKIDGYIHLWTFIYFYGIILLSLVFCLLFKNNQKVITHSQLFLGLIYMGCGVGLFFHSYYFFKQHNTYGFQNSKVSLQLVTASVLTFACANWIGVALAKETSIARYLKGYNRFLFVLMYVFFIVYFMELKWLDYAVSCFFSIYAFLIGRRIFIAWRYDDFPDKIQITAETP